MKPETINPNLSYQQGTLHFGQVNLHHLAQEHGTPLYVYCFESIQKAFLEYAHACPNDFKVNICYAVKANSNIHLLRELATLGAHFDIVSAGELKRLLTAGIPAQKAVFAGVGKTKEEIKFALTQHIGCFNVESFQEMQRIAQIARELNQIATVSLRVNPDVDAQTHPYISTGLKENKFGVPFNQALEVYRFANAHPHLSIHGIDCHIGSQLIDSSPYSNALDRVLSLVDELAKTEKIIINHLDLGGGLGIRYKNETPPNTQHVLQSLAAQVKNWAVKNNKVLPSLSFEPGRSIVGNAGILLTEVQYLKTNEDKQFAVVDAAMNDLMRPALYQAYHGVIPITLNANRTQHIKTYDIVGPVCETGDWLAKNRELSLSQGDFLAILSAGAYGQTMASNYNTRGRAAEILIKNRHQPILIRRRETIDDQLITETNL